MKLRILVFAILLIALGKVNAQKQSSEQYITKYKLIAIDEMLTYKIPASITLAQGILESGNGNSRLATKANNHFGIKCHSDWKGKRIYHDDDQKNECFRKYPKAEDSYRDHSLFLSKKKRYADLFKLKITNYKAWAKGLKKAGYATNPKYPKRLIGLIERYELYKYDNVTKMDFEKMIADALSNPENKSIIPERYIQKHKAPDAVAITQNPKKRTAYTPIAYHNRIKYIIAQEGDSPEKIMKEFDIWAKQFYKFNDLKPGDQLKPGMIVYLQPKRRKGDVKYHIVEANESLWEISQQHGIKLSWLLKRNHLKENSRIRKGQKLWLRKTKPAPAASY